MKPRHDSPLAALGFDEDSEHVYAVALRNPSSALHDLAWEAGLDPERFTAAIARLREAGLVTAVGEQIAAAPPEEGIGIPVDLTGFGEAFDALP